MGKPTNPKKDKVATSGADYNPYDPKTTPQQQVQSVYSPSKKGSPAWFINKVPQWLGLNQQPAQPKPPTSGADYNPYNPKTPPQQGSEGFTWRPSDFQAPNWLNGGASNIGAKQTSGQYNNPYAPMPKPRTPSNSMGSQYGVSGNIFNPETMPNVPSQIANAQGQMPTIPTWFNAGNNPNYQQVAPVEIKAGTGPYGTNPTSLASQTGVYGIAPWLIPAGQTQGAVDYGGGGYSPFGTRYKGWGGGGGYGGGSYDNSYLPPWYMNLFSWNYKG
jgi:hypothetical protein